MLTVIKAWVMQYAMLILAAVAASGWVFGGVQTIRLSAAKSNLAETKAEFSDYRLRSTQAAVDATNAARSEETRRHEALRKVVDDEALKTKSARADADAASAALERLRKRLASTGSSGATGNPVAATTSPPASEARDLQSDMLIRVGEAAGQLASYADSSNIAGDSCQRAYEALTK